MDSGDSDSDTYSTVIATLRADAGDLGADGAAERARDALALCGVHAFARPVRADGCTFVSVARAGQPTEVVIAFLAGEGARVTELFGSGRVAMLGAGGETEPPCRGDTRTRRLTISGVIAGHVVRTPRKTTSTVIAVVRIEEEHEPLDATADDRQLSLFADVVGTSGTLEATGRTVTHRQWGRP